ncbi:MAG: Hpt domain-containing protein [Pseudomonadota bacterium]
MSETAAIIDKALAVERAGGNTELARELFQMLQSELPVYRAKLRSLFDSSDLPALTEAVHKLNGSATYCGVPALKRAADRFESSLKRGEEEHYQHGLNELLHAIDQLMEAASPFP